MNWLEIDKLLLGIIARHNSTEDIFLEAEKQFKWNRSQSEAAINPLLKRYRFDNISHTSSKTLPKKVANKRKSC
jgi:hypothetical protein